MQPRVTSRKGAGPNAGDKSPSASWLHLRRKFLSTPQEEEYLCTFAPPSLCLACPQLQVLLIHASLTSAILLPFWGPIGGKNGSDSSTPSVEPPWFQFSDSPCESSGWLQTTEALRGRMWTADTWLIDSTPQQSVLKYDPQVFLLLARSFFFFNCVLVMTASISTDAGPYTQASNAWPCLRHQLAALLLHSRRGWFELLGHYYLGNPLLSFGLLCCAHIFLDST